MQILKKISISTVNALPKGGFKGIAERIFAMRVLGQARTSEIVTSQYGDAVKFKGEFRAWGQDGVESVSSVCYLPSPIDGLLSNALEISEGKPVEFAFDIFVLPDERSTTGYVYRVETLTEAAPSDPVARLASNLPALALPQPKAAGEPEGKPTDPAKAEAPAADAKKPEVAKTGK